MFEQNSSGWMDMLQIFHAKSIVLLILSKLHWTSYLFRIWKGECFCCFHCSLLCHVPTFNSPLILSACSMCWCNMRREILQHSSWEFIIMQGSLDVGNVVRLKTKINKKKTKLRTEQHPVTNMTVIMIWKCHTSICSVLFSELFLPLSETTEFSGITCLQQENLAFTPTYSVRWD